MAQERVTFTVHDIEQVWKENIETNFYRSVRMLDHYTTTTIASYACIRMSDSNGNPSDTYWKCFVMDPKKQYGLLMNVETVEKVVHEVQGQVGGRVPQPNRASV